MLKPTPPTQVTLKPNPQTQVTLKPNPQIQVLFIGLFLSQKFCDTFAVPQNSV